jgi:hypothetical protein
MRDLDTIDSELRLLAAVRWSIREHGGEPSSRQVDELLDERLAHPGPCCDDLGVTHGSTSNACGGLHIRRHNPLRCDPLRCGHNPRRLWRLWL